MKTNIMKGKCQAKLEIPEGWCEEGEHMDIFQEQHNTQLSCNTLFHIFQLKFYFC